MVTGARAARGSRLRVIRDEQRKHGLPVRFLKLDSRCIQVFLLVNGGVGGWCDERVFSSAVYLLPRHMASSFQMDVNDLFFPLM